MLSKDKLKIKTENELYKSNDNQYKIINILKNLETKLNMEGSNGKKKERRYFHDQQTNKRI
jgi:hypothetical protein